MVRSSEGWFSHPGAESDVIVSSRARLARNLSGIPFPPGLSKDQEEEIQRRVVTAFQQLPDSYEAVYLDRLPPLERSILMERNIISQEFAGSPNKLVFISPDGHGSAMVNEEDHLRLACIRTGLCLEEVFREADHLDSQLEKNLHFAASMEWGYLSSSLHNCGTGLRASAMLHLPALALDGTIGWALKRVAQTGLQIKGYWGDGDNSLGDMYQLSNAFSLGHPEKEIIGSVSRIALELAEYERKAREEMLKSQRLELEDRIYRAAGVLGSCRLLSSKEAITLLSTVRLGISIAVLKEPALEIVTSLMMLCQKAHVQKMLDQTDDETDNKLVDYTRARLIRHALLGRVREDDDV